MFKRIKPQFNKILICFCRFIGHINIIRIKVKRKINVVFLVGDLGMWKSNELYKKLAEDDRFNPVVMSFLGSRTSIKEQEDLQNSIREYFVSKKFSYKDCFDYENGRYNSIFELQPDVVFFQQPYETNLPFAPIRKLMFRSVFFYIPYTAMSEPEPAMWDGVLQNISVCLFYPSTIHKELAEELMTNKGRNIVVAGLPLYENLLLNIPNGNEWKIKDSSIKRIIWAPHHSILKDDILDYSNFLQIADDMLNLAEQYRNKIQIAFKPHPHLKPKLEREEVWGKEKTKLYFDKWRDMENTIYVTGEYLDLFKTSDALIHDCSTFTAEYILTGKPCMYITKSNHLNHMNKFGELCYREHYIGNSIDDIISFIENVVIEGKDYLKNKRDKFRDDFLLPPGGKLTSEVIFEKISSIF